jgi:hypothetical protein
MGEGSCLFCAPGNYSSGGEAACTVCAPGSVTNTHAASGARLCRVCTRGQFAPSSTGTCEACGSGQFARSQGSSSCEKCVPGKYLPSKGGGLCLDCDAGQYSLTDGASRDLCVPCEAGMFQTKVGSVFCRSCDAGRYRGQLDPADLAASCIACYPGRTSIAEASSCAECLPGSVTDKLGASGAVHCNECEAGKFSMSPTVACAFCIPGSYCKNGHKIVCEPGMYSDDRGTKVCKLCDSGQYGDSTNLTTSDCSGPCTRGYYCSAGTASSRPAENQCGASTLCPEGSSIPLAVPVGVYVDESQTVHDCEKGFKCSSGKRLSCLAGSYQNEERQFLCRLCERGRWQNKTGSVSCILCKPGKYMPATGGESDVACADCPVGSITNTLNESGASSCTLCPSSHYSPDPAVACKICTLGSFCQGGERVACNEGTFSDTEGAKRCPSCPAGRYGSEEGLSSTNCSGLCHEGFFCPSASTSGTLEQNKCEAGTFCPAGSAIPQPTSIGVWVDKSHKLWACPPGFKCSGGSKTACSAGSYQDKERQFYCDFCEAGRYQHAKSSTSCLVCGPGRYTPAVGGASEAVCEECELGKAQAGEGQSNCFRCSNISGSKQYQDEMGQTTCKACTTCMEGRDRKACGGAQVGFCVDCAPGKYVNASSRDCSSCPMNYFSMDNNLAFCTECPVSGLQMQPVYTQCFRSIHNA